MTAHAIVAKLNALMGDAIDSECKVVYVLCETRKLLEQGPAHKRPFALNMYCHWALHVNLQGKDTIEAFLQQVDDYVEEMLVGSQDIQKSARMVREFVFFDEFRSQLRDFWLASGIRTDLTDDDTCWKRFVEQYAGVIEDGALSIKTQHGLKHIAEVRFKKGRSALGEFTHLPFEMVWLVSLRDGRVAEINVSVRPPQQGAGQMIATGFHLR